MVGATKRSLIIVIVLSVFLGSIFGAASGFWASALLSQDKNIPSWMSDVFADREEESGAERKIVQVEEQSAVIDAVKKASPAVVSIVVTKELPEIRRSPGFFGDDFFFRFFGQDHERFFSTPEGEQQEPQKRQVAGGTGFVVSSDGYIVTNRHVVSDRDADYTVVVEDEQEYEAKVLARDPVIDLAILKIEGEDLPFVELGDSSSLQVGQRVIAIGNALGEFRDTVSTGVVSGLSRSITAGGIGTSIEHLSGVIQTDASINPGNSGGPLLDISGQVIGVNTAMAEGAENIGFAIPVNDIKDTLNDVREHGRIIQAWLGVRYITITPEISQANNLGVDHGALIVRGRQPAELAVIPGSPADKAGLEANDIILEVDGEEINQNNSLADVINKSNPGDVVTMLVLRAGEESEIEVELEERS